MQKVLSFGKVSTKELGYSAMCEVEIEVKLENGRLSIMGSVWKPSRQDVIMAGQCWEELLKLLPNDPKLKRIVEVWERWHLNDMRAGCEHQRTPEMEARLNKIVKRFRFSLNADTLRKQNKIKDYALETLKDKAYAGINEEEQRILCLPYERIISTFEDEAPPEAPEGYVFAKEYTRPNPETKTLRWLTVAEHPEGMLSRPCEVCGYKFGNAWIKEEIPADIIAEIESW